MGGSGGEQFLVLEMHYDNPGGVSGKKVQQNPETSSEQNCMSAGVLDSSGFRFFYTLEEPTHRAGILILGHIVNPVMIVPPETRNYTVAGFCSSDCTRLVCYCLSHI